MVHRFKQKLLSLNVTNYLKKFARDISGMVQFGGEIATLASTGEIILSPEEMTFKSLAIRTKYLTQSFHKMPCMGTLILVIQRNIGGKQWVLTVFSAAIFDAHMQLIEKQNFDFVLSLALYSSQHQPSVLLPCQAEALEIILNLSRSPLGLLLWMPHGFYAPGVGLFGTLSSSSGHFLQIPENPNGLANQTLFERFSRHFR